MNLSPKAFDDLFFAGTLRLAFIGMSNIGKSYTATRLHEAYGFELIEVDTLIWQHLGYHSMQELAAWQGQPFEPGYRERELRSIELESKAAQHAIALTKHGTIKKNTIIDTPGSIIYTDTKTLNALSEHCFIVHIKADDADIERLKSDYFAHPKPLIWNGHFKNDPQYSDQDNILNSYPELLKARAKLYKDLADISLNSSFVLNPNVTAQDILAALRPLAG